MNYNQWNAPQAKNQRKNKKNNKKSSSLLSSLLSLTSIKLIFVISVMLSFAQPSFAMSGSPAVEQSQAPVTTPVTDAESATDSTQDSAANQDQDQTDKKPASNFIVDAFVSFISPSSVYFTTLYLPRSLDTSFKYISNFGNAATWDKQALSSAKISDGEIDVGTQFEITSGIKGLAEFALPYKVVTYRQNDMIVFEGQNGFIKYKDTLRFREYGLGTRLEYTAEISFTGLLGIFNPLFSLFWNMVGDGAVEGMPAALLANTSDDLESDDQITQKINQLFAQQNNSLSSRERAFLDKLHTLAGDIDFYSQGLDQFTPASNAAYDHIKNNIRTRLIDIEDMAREHYSNANTAFINIEDRVLLARNAFLLMSYYTFSQEMPDFLWTKLGSFAANEVRRGLVLALSLERILSVVDIVIPDELSDIDAVELAREAAGLLLEGQLNVFVDVGSLALMDAAFGASQMSLQTWLTPEASRGFIIQEQAIQAKSLGDNEEYMHLRAQAAIEFGAHEQIYTLQPLWDQPLLSLFAAFNNVFLRLTDNQFALVQPHIYLGENQFAEDTFGPFIIAPKHATDLTIAEFRVDIARNGFNTLTQLLQNPLHALWINAAQNSMGHAKNLYQPLGLNWLPNTP